MKERPTVEEQYRAEQQNRPPQEPRGPGSVDAGVWVIASTIVILGVWKFVELVINFGMAAGILG